MTLLREILSDQTKTLLQHQTKSQADLEKKMLQSQSDIRADIRRELTQGQAALKKEIQEDLNHESQAFGRSCTSLDQDLQQGVQSAERGIQEVKAAQGNLETRLQALESRSSDAGTVTSTAPPGRKAALVLGGWDPDSTAADMLEHAKILIKELRLDLDTDEIFVPGGRRGRHPPLRSA